MRFLFLFCFFLVSLHAGAQTIDDVIALLKKEEWSKSAEVSLALLNQQTDSVNADQPSVLRYMYIKSVAGLLNQHVISKEEALKQVKAFENHRLILAGHPILKKCSLNCIQLASDEPNTLFTCATNSQGTEIHAFEYVTLKENIVPEDMDALEGKTGRLQGLLESIGVEGNALPRFKLTLTHGELVVY